MRKNDNTKRLDEFFELLDNPYKLSEIDRLMVESEINRLLINQRCSKKHGKRTPKILNKHKYLVKDKAKHGCYHYKPSNRRQYLLKYANKLVRHSHLFSPKGKGYKKVFDVAWELW